MGITDRQRKRHHLNLGSSDMASLFGYSRYRTGYDVYISKTGGLEQQETAAMRGGNLYERVMLDYAEQEFGRIRRNVERRVKGTPILDHSDALILATRIPVECKRVQDHEQIAQYGEPGTGDVPLDVFVQCQCHIMAHGAPECKVIVDLPYHRLPEIYIVPSLPDMQEAIKVMAIDFMAMHVKPRIPPEGQPSVSLLPFIKRAEGKTVVIDPDLLAEYEACNEQEKTARKNKDDAKAKLLAAMGDAEIGQTDTHRITYLHEPRKGYVVEASNPRVFRVTELKGESNG